MDDLIALWSRYARAGRASALNRERAGDPFGAQLSLARSEVRALAAKILRDSTDPVAAAVLMHQSARRLRLDDLPLIGFDQAAVRYVQARAWQDCARTLHPALPIVQRKLDFE